MYAQQGGLADITLVFYSRHLLTLTVRVLVHEVGDSVNAHILRDGVLDGLRSSASDEVLLVVVHIA